MTNSKRGRPSGTAKPSKNVNMRLPLDVAERLENVQASTGLPFTTVLVAALRQHLNLPSAAERLNFEAGE